MSTMDTKINYDTIINKNADELFVEYSVDEVGRIVEKLNDDVTTKRQRLKMLVGNKYRDLLNVADDIIKMNEITTLENEKLMDLAFKRSNYNSKSLSNLSKFNKSLKTFRIEKIQNQNRKTILHNVVHDLNYSLITLKHEITLENPINNNDRSIIDSDDLDDQIDNYQPVSNNFSNTFVLIAKHIFLVNYFFKEEINEESKSFAIAKFNQLCEEFNNLIESHLINLTHESDSDFVLNLLLAYLISNHTTPTLTIQWLLEKRLSYVETLIQSDTKFQDLLTYIFITIEYVKVAKVRISSLIYRLKNSTNLSSNWLNQTSFKKWIKWLREIAHIDLNDESKSLYEFQIDSYEINSSQLENKMNTWKLQIAHNLLTSFDKRFKKSNENENLIALVNLLKYVLISFKHFTSLTALQIEDSKEPVVQYIINKWSTLFSIKLENQLNKFNNIKDLVLTTFNNDETIIKIVANSKDSILTEFNENFKLDSFLNSANNDNVDEVFILAEKFKHDLKSIIKSIESLKLLSSVVLKPIISIDDFEDVEFWLTISHTLKKLLDNNVQNSILILNKSINDFFGEISSLLDSNKSIRNTKIFYIIRVLAELEEKIRLNEIYATFNKYSTNAINKQIKLESLIEPLLENCFELITNAILNQYEAKINELFKVDTDDENSEYPECILWETVTSKNLRIPTLCSIDYSTLILKLCNNLITSDNLNHSNQFTLKSFDNPRTKIINKFINILETNINKLDDSVNQTKLLLYYSNYIFTLCLLDATSIKLDSKMIEMFGSLNVCFKDEEYTTKVENAILENYKSQSLLFYPLSK